MNEIELKRGARQWCFATIFRNIWMLAEIERDPPVV